MPEPRRSLLEQFLFVGSQPTLVGWNRLEPRPRKREFDRALRAEVRDPLWMLARQWQFGEFRGEDAGSPVAARVELQTTWIDRYAPRKQSALVLADAPAQPSSLPLETLVERELPPIDAAMSVQLGRYWLRMLGTLGLSIDVRPAFERQWPFRPPSRDAPPSVRQWYAAVAGRSMNGGAFHAHLEGGGDPLQGISAATTDDAVAIHAAALRFLAWFRQQYEVPTPREDAWAPSYLEYRFELSAPDDRPIVQTSASRETVLVADDHRGGPIDWYAFDIDPMHPGLRRPPGAGHAMQQRELLERRPTPLEFRGMPSPRWWQLESRGPELGEHELQMSDTAKLLLTESMLVYANDWFVLPLAVPVGTFATIAGLIVTDNFGGRVSLRAADHGPMQRWNMYTLTTRGRRWSSDERLFIAPVATRVQQGDDIERVNLIRDELSDIVWAIESLVSLEDGRAVPGSELGPAGGFDERMVSEAESDARLHYELLHGPVPRHWIPFVPARVLGPNREVQLRRAASRPRSELLRVGLAKGAPYYVHEEEVPHGGTIVSRSWQRARGHDGRVHTWLARFKRNGRTEGALALRFDAVVSGPDGPS